jgi:hypothetical protein
MATTIRLDDRTLKQLATLKQELKARSYPEVVQTLLAQRQKLPSSPFGSGKGSRPYKHTRLEPRDVVGKETYERILRELKTLRENWR